MPNWVYNGVTITDPSGSGKHTSDIERLVAQVGAEYSMDMPNSEGGTSVVVTNEPLFSFWNIVKPTGEDLKEYYESSWYEWNTTYWGCKWDASEVELDEYGSEKHFRFATPWSPPLPVLAELSRQYPELEIELDWEEEQGFGGTFVFTNGNATETNSYDIPNSHADFIERDRECYCESFPEDAFADCPSYVSPEMIIPEDELIVEQMI